MSNEVTHQIPQEVIDDILRGVMCTMTFIIVNLLEDVEDPCHAPKWVEMLVRNHLEQQDLRCEIANWLWHPLNKYDLVPKGGKSNE